VKKLFLLGILIPMIFMNGCAGLGFYKKATLMPDEVWVAVDGDPKENGELTEITTGFKWKFN